MIETYILKNKDYVTRINSRSGGIFSLLSDYVLSMNGVIYGAVMDMQNRKVVHIRSENEKVRDLMRGSKYCQSMIGDVFVKVANDLVKGRKVLFSGTPCQVAALRSLNLHNSNNLICVDIVCHGVPSIIALDSYLECLEKSRKQQVVAIDFRNKKKYGWSDHVETICFKDGSCLDDNKFAFMFSKHAIIRPSCYECKFKNLNRLGDITIGDAWGIEKNNNDFNDENGVSLVFLNTELGKNIFDKIKSGSEYRKVEIDDFLQEALFKNYSIPNDRKKVWKILKNKGFMKAYNYTRKKYIFNKIVGKFFRRKENA